MSMERGFKAKIVAGAALALLFTSGVVVGLAWDRTAAAATPDEVREERGRRGRGGDNGMIVDNVGLTSVQKSSVDSLVADYRGRMKGLSEEFNSEYRPRYRALITDLREEIKQVLTDEQSAMYESLLAEHDAKRRARRDRSPNGNNTRK